MKIKYLSIICILSILIISKYLYADGTLYVNLHSLYVRWSDNNYGSGKYYRKAIYSFLLDSLGSSITTDYDFILAYPYEMANNKVGSKFLISDWLIISCQIPPEDLFNQYKSKKENPGKFWNNKLLISISGKITKFRLIDDNDLTDNRKDNRIVLYLDDVVIKTADDM